jgi:hypothetical protein
LHRRSPSGESGSESVGLSSVSFTLGNGTRGYGKTTLVWNCTTQCPRGARTHACTHARAAGATCSAHRSWPSTVGHGPSPARRPLYATPRHATPFHATPCQVPPIAGSTCAQAVRSGRSLTSAASAVQRSSPARAHGHACALHPHRHSAGRTTTYM